MTDDLLEQLTAASDVAALNWERWGVSRRIGHPLGALSTSAGEPHGLRSALELWSAEVPNWSRHVQRASRALEALRGMGVQSIPITDRRFPPPLRTIAPPPLVIHVSGSVQALGTGVAIVGSREPSQAGIEAAKAVAQWCSEMQLPIITGMARGTDKAAARAAIDYGGTLIGVVPGGPHEIIPRESEREYFDGRRQGCIISETTGAYPVDKSSFLRRNRLISGLSRLVFVASTKSSGGTINQLEWAQRQGRPSIVYDAGAEPGFTAEIPSSRIAYHLTSKASLTSIAGRLWTDPALSSQQTLDDE